ncbi:MAG: hypothetical protein RL695_2296, partial [Pseudomonadota bacterium]
MPLRVIGHASPRMANRRIVYW